LSLGFKEEFMLAIPTRFLELLNRREDTAAGAFIWMKTYLSIFEFSHVPFFRDYTDHGPTHVERVLAGMDRLIPEHSFPRLAPEDIAVAVVAAVLHDAALHLNEDGFISLISSDRLLPDFRMLGDQPWPKIWKEYLEDAYRWDDRKKRGIIGDAKTINPPPPNPDDFSDRDRRLIGEFLRRHHARLAHEFAVLGFPTAGGEPLTVASGGLDMFLDIIGLVARSHGMRLRDTFAYLTQKGGNPRKFGPIHTVYLMAVLRIADYLEIEPARAPNLIPRIHRIRSPISRAEWQSHDAVQFLNDTLDDQEAILVQTAPPDVSTFLRLKHLLSSLQAELDVTWAVLGEVYGRVLPDLSMTLRRVFSNIDDEGEFAKRVLYIPRHVNFRSAGADLLKLLISPLYGDAPEVGIRELVQNAVDAVRVRRRYSEGADAVTSIENSPPAVELSIYRDSDGIPWLTIVDQGIGMDADVVANYFLNAGASYRRSEEWRRKNLNQSGQSEIYYTGRFGIGLLSAFILGEEIEVCTRNVAQEDGLRFTATIEAESIELMKDRCSIGTQICIRLRESVYHRLTSGNINTVSDARKTEDAWDWYCLSDPEVVRSSSGTVLAQRWIVPSVEAEIHQNWRRFYPPLYSAVDWSFDPAPSLVCNGFRVSYDAPKKRLHGLRSPNLSVWDPDGEMPLTVRRDALQTEELPFENELIESVVKDFIAHSLVTAPSAPFLKSTDKWKFISARYWGVDDRESDCPYWLSTADGIVPVDEWHFSEIDLKELLMIPVFADAPSLPLVEIDECPAVFPVPARTAGAPLFDLDSSLDNQTLDWFSDLFRNPLLPSFLTRRPRMSTTPPFSPFDFVGGQLIVRGSSVRHRSTIIDLARRYDRIGGDRDTVIFEFGRCDPSTRDFMKRFSDQLTQQPNTHWPGIVVRWFIERKNVPTLNEPSTLAKVWSKALARPVIPYDPAVRELLITDHSLEFENLLKANQLRMNHVRRAV
jgi:molecular chaperone HtpG